MFKTLLVEDNLNYRVVLKNALLARFIDVEIHEASDDSEALRAVDAYNPDLVIMDINLKCGMNGLDLTKIIKAEHPEIVVVILSQHDAPEYRSAAQKYSADLFLSKRFSLERIFEDLTTVIVSEYRSVEQTAS